MTLKIMSGGFNGTRNNKIYVIQELERAPKYDNYDNEEVLKRILSLKKSTEKNRRYREMV